MAEDWRDKPFEELTKEQIEQLRREEADEAPSTAQVDGAWKYNQTFTGVKVRYDGAEEYLNALAERANLNAQDYMDARQEAMHYIATQTLFDFDKPVDNFVFGIIKSMGLSNLKIKKRIAANNLSRIVYPIARRMIPPKLLEAYRMYPEAFIRMEGIHLQDTYIGLDGNSKTFNAWIELDLPAYLTSQDVHDELNNKIKENEHFAYKFRMAIRNVHRASTAYRRVSFKVMLKMADVKKMTYGGFANSYPVTFHGVCKYITNVGLNRLVEENAELHGAIAKGLTGLKDINV